MILAALEPTGPQLLYVLGGIMGLLGIYVLILSGISKHREVFGEHPPLAVELRDLRKELEKYAPRETVNKIVEQLGTYVTDGRLREVLKAIKEDEEKLRSDFHGDIEQLRKDVRHDVRGELNDAGLAQADYREDMDAMREKTDAKLDTKFSEAIKANNISATKLHERIETLGGALRTEIDNKVEIVRREVGAMPGKLVELLKSTGAIGGRRA